MAVGGKRGWCKSVCETGEPHQVMSEEASEIIFGI
jgi:hypothetical protein